MITATGRGRMEGARGTRTRLAVLALCGVALCALALASIGVGSQPIAPDTILSVLSGHGTGNDATVITALRLPRTLAGILVGMALGVSGALIQALTRNPLADPGILGVTSGAAFAIVAAIFFFGVGSIWILTGFAFAGAIAAAILVYAIGTMGPRGATPVQLTLCGVALSALLSGLGGGLALLDVDVFNHMRAWTAGALSGRGYELSLPLLPFFFAGLAIAALAAPGLNAMALGDEMASALGARIGRLRLWVVLAVTLLVGAATALAGPIGFVGLMVPHIARWTMGPDQRWIIAFTALFAPVLLLAADIAGRLLVQPAELPVGIVTAFIGAPVLIGLVRSKKASRL